MFQKLLQLAAIAMLGFLLSACDNGDESDLPAATATPVADLTSLLVASDELDPQWVDGLPLDEFGLGWTIRLEPTNPPVCAVQPEPRQPMLEVSASYQQGPDLGHGPFLYNTVATFPPGEAEALLDEIAMIADSCPDEVLLGPSEVLQSEADRRQTEQPDVTVKPVVTWVFSPLSLPPMGEQTVAFKRSTRGPVQHAEVDTVLIRQGDVVSFVYHFSLGETDTQETQDIARDAAARLEALGTS